MIKQLQTYLYSDQSTNRGILNMDSRLKIHEKPDQHEFNQRLLRSHYHILSPTLEQ